MSEIIRILINGDFYGAGKYTEIAKGKNEYVDNLQDAKQKINRVWQSRR